MFINRTILLMKRSRCVTSLYVASGITRTSMPRTQLRLPEWRIFDEVESENRNPAGMTATAAGSFPRSPKSHSSSPWWRHPLSPRSNVGKESLYRLPRSPTLITPSPPLSFSLAPVVSLRQRPRWLINIQWPRGQDKLIKT